jgi:hypothetical protein
METVRDVVMDPVILFGYSFLLSIAYMESVSPAIFSVAAPAYPVLGALFVIGGRRAYSWMADWRHEPDALDAEDLEGEAPSSKSKS